MTSWRKLREQIACSAGQSTLSFDEDLVVSPPSPTPRSFPAYPFIKWAGGKTQLLPQLSALAPAKIDRYFEPFLGGGAFFFHLMSQGKITSSASISDANPDLINVYIAIRDDHVTLIDLLEPHVAPLLELVKLPKGHALRKPPNYYYTLRDNSYNTKDSIGIRRSAEFIALNKSCYNGLHRVNGRCKFNVPLGRRTKPKAIYNSDNLQTVSRVLRSTKPNVIIRTCDYGQILNEAKAGDFIYFDPPYHGLSDTAYFTGYTEKEFLDREQKQLAGEFEQLEEMGCKVMLTNSDTQLIRELYAGFNIRAVQSKRSINSDAEKRSGSTDLIIRNYDNNSSGQL